MSRVFQIANGEKGEDTETPIKNWEESVPEVMDLIEQTRRAIATLTEPERFHRAQVHFEDALKYKNPRIDIFDQHQALPFKLAYYIQNSIVWEFIVKCFSFISPYLIVFNDTGGESIYQFGSLICLIFLWADLILELVHISRDKIRTNSKYSSIIFVKVFILTLLIVQTYLVVQTVSNSQGRELNPLRVFRCFLPILFVSEVRRSFEALISAYKQFAVFVTFYFLIVVGFGLIACIIIKIPVQLQSEVDEFTSNYDDLPHMIFITYVCGTYDVFPDNQLLAFQISRWFEIFFVIFIFLNMFMFSSIPGSMLFDAFISTRSKYILIDQIKMQHSLILAFVSLGDKEYEISIKKIMSFFHFLYQDRARYIDAITELCLKLNDDGNCSIHVLQFIQIGRAIQEKPYLKPPIVNDIQLWIRFRTAFNEVIPLKKWLKMNILPVFLSLFALFGVINSFFCLYSGNSTFLLIDDIVSYLFLVDIFIRVIGDGPENYFNKEWNTMDMSVILIGLLFTITSVSTVFPPLLKILRIYRISALAKLLFQNKFIQIEFELLQKFKNLFEKIIIILPIIIRFVPLFLIFYYILGIVGMQIFYQTARMDPTDYGSYDQFSNFKKFINTQFYLVQVLTQAGWSSVVNDYAKRNIDHYFLVIMFFVMCHVIIVLVLAAILKGTIWFVYITVSQLSEEQEKSQKAQEDQIEEMKEKVKELSSLEYSLKGSSLFKYDTVLKRNLFEIKSNSQILLQIKNSNRKSGLTCKKQKSLNLKIYRQFESNKMLINKQTEQISSIQNFLFTMLKSFPKTSNKMRLEDMQEVEKEDIEQHINELVETFKLNTTKFEYQINSCPIIKKHLVQKLNAPYLANTERLDQNMNIISEQFTNKKSLQFHIFTLHLLLDIQTQKRKQKELVIENLSEEGFIDECDSRILINKKTIDQSFRIDQDCTIRQMYLEDTNKDFIEKFQAEYFSDIFGPSFKETNKITIEPLIKLQSTLTYAIKKLMRNPQINSIEFFKILSQIQYKISNNLLKKGSLFKFVYQLNKNTQTWFTVHYTALNETKISFLKHGVWVYHESLIQNQIYHAKDIFKSGKNLENQDLLERATIMKKLFQTFQTLALTLPDHQSFFDSNPSYHTYDTFLTYIDVEKMQRLAPKDIEISKIMAVMLTKEEERLAFEPLQYPISEINTSKPIDNIDFKLNQTESETFKKLGNLYALNDQEITANEGLPFAYVLNFLCEISDILKLYTPNFTHQVETVLNQQATRLQCLANKLNVSQVIQIYD